MRGSEEKIVDDTKYIFTMFTAGKSIRLLAKLAKIIGKPIGIIVSSGMEAQVTPAMIGEAIQEMASSASPEDFEQTARDLLQGTKIFREGGNVSDLNFDLDFQGRIGHLSRVLKEMFTFQYSGFLGDRADASTGTPAAVARPVRAL